MKNLIYILLLFSSDSFGASLEELHEQARLDHTSPQKYSKSKQLLFKFVDNINGSVCSAYTPKECKFQNPGPGVQSPRGFNLNIEHTWPQSKGAKSFPARGDMHHLYVASKESNSKRANHPFCIVYESDWEKQGSMLGIDEDYRTCFEPVDSHKGNVARAMFYFSTRYRVDLSPSQEKLFRNWTKLDPVDHVEIDRNSMIETLQGNRNPFIDDESLVEKIPSFYFVK